MADLEVVKDSQDAQEESPKPSPAPSGAQTFAGKDLAKLLGGAVFLLGSVVMMVHRMPHRQYVAVHADKPVSRPRAAVDTDSPEPAPKPSAKPSATPAVAAKPGAAPAKPALASKPGEPAAPGLELVAPEKAPMVDLADACSAEAPLLCYRVPDGRLARCLRGYEDYLTKSCLDALPGATASHP